LSGADRQQPAIQETLTTLAEAHEQISEMLTNTQPAPARAPDPCALRISLRALVENEFAHRFERIVWRDENDGDDREFDPVYVDPMVGEVILGAAREAIRNAASHGRGGQTDRFLSLWIDLCTEEGESGEFTLTIADDGVGIEAGRSITAGGSGNGLALHSTLLAMMGGYLAIESPPEGGTRVKITAPRA
jgi:signal transduction histidine kinase